MPRCENSSSCRTCLRSWSHSAVERLAQPPVAAAGVVRHLARLAMRVVVIERVFRRGGPGRNHAVELGARAPVVTAFEHKSALMIDELPPGQTGVVPLIKTLVFVRKLPAAGPGRGNRFVELQPSTLRRNADERPRDAFAQRGGLSLERGIAPGLHQVSAAREYRAPLRIVRLGTAPTFRADLRLGKEFFVGDGVDPRLGRRDALPLLLREGQPCRQRVDGFFAFFDRQDRRGCGPGRGQCAESQALQRSSAAEDVDRGRSTCCH